jgi:hypothetical protein
MEKVLVSILIAMALILGAVAGAVFAPADVEIKEVPVEKLVNVSVEKIVEVEAPSALDNAVAIFLDAVEDEEDKAGNAVNVLGIYNFDEVSVLKVYDDYVVSYDGDETTVEFKIRLQLDDGDDRTKESYDVTVITEDGEDSKVIVA